MLHATLLYVREDPTYRITVLIRVASSPIIIYMALMPNPKLNAKIAQIVPIFSKQIDYDNIKDFI